MMLKRPFGWVDDRLGVAGFYAKPQDDNGGALREEYGLEAFWRFQLTPRLDLTPDLQLYLQPGRNDRDDPVAVFGLRLRYIL
jgi:carbohydrate-selective porin OprB